MTSSLKIIGLVFVIPQCDDNENTRLIDEECFGWTFILDTHRLSY